MIFILLDMGNVFVHNGGVVDKNDSWLPDTDARIRETMRAVFVTDRATSS